MKSLLKILDGCWISRLRFSFCYCYCLLALLAAGNASPVGTSRWNSRRMRPPSCPTCCPLTSSTLLVNESRLNTGLYLKRLVLRWSCRHRNQKSAGENISPRTERTFLFRSYKSCSGLLFFQIQRFEICLSQKICCEYIVPGTRNFNVFHYFVSTVKRRSSRWYDYSDGI